MTGVDDNRIALISRFWAAMTVTVHGTFGALLFYALFSSLDEIASAPNVVAAVILAGSAASAGWGLHRSKRSRRSIFVPLACAPIPIAVLLHWLMVPFSLPASLAHAPWALYAIWVAPSLLAVLSGLLAALSEKNVDRPKKPYEPGDTAVPLPIVSSAGAILVYATLGVLIFALTAGFSRAYVPGSVVTGAIFLCSPFIFLAVGLSFALARHIERARPILVAGLLSLAVMCPALLFTAGGFGLLLYLVIALPLIWPTVRAWQIVRAEMAERGSRSTLV